MEIYFDHAATTYMDARVKEVMDRYFLEEYGNPGSFNTVGLRAKHAVDESRGKIAELLNCDTKEVVFTGSGTESINLAIKGFVKANKKGNHIITQKTEHEAVIETCEYLEKEEGIKVTYLDVDEYGLIKLEDLKKAITEETILVSIMYANNEIGTIQNIKEIASLCKENKIKFHTDACQAAGYLNIDVKDLGVDMMSVNGGKLYGPKGIGLLYVKRGTMLKPLIHGGGQENGLRSGTENVPGIVGFSKALEVAQEDKDNEVVRLTNLRDYMINNILEKVPKTFLNGHPSSRLPNNVNISFLEVEGEAVMLMLNNDGICASSGSACTSKTLDPSHVILAIGLPYEAAHGSIRFTLGKRSTKEGIDKLLEVLPGVIKELRQISPVSLKMEEVGK